MGEVRMDEKEYTSEHKRLIRILRSGGKSARDAEARRQLDEARRRLGARGKNNRDKKKQE